MYIVKWSNGRGRKKVSYKAAATLATYQNDVNKFSFQACRYQKSSILPI